METFAEEDGRAPGSAGSHASLQKAKPTAGSMACQKLEAGRKADGTGKGAHARPSEQTLELSFLAEVVGAPAPAPGVSGTRKETLDWRRWLAGGGPREVLARIVPGDPLGLRALVARHLRAQALLVDGDRLYMRTLALCARAATSYRGRPAIAQWLDGLVQDALAELAQEVSPIASGVGQVVSDFARRLGLDPPAMERTCRAFADLPSGDRRAFFDLVIEQRSLDELAQSAGVSASEIARRARRALHALLAEATPSPQASPTVTPARLEP